MKDVTPSESEAVKVATGSVAVLGEVRRYVLSSMIIGAAESFSLVTVTATIRSA